MEINKKEFARAFGGLMAEAREKKGLKQREVAEELGISQPYLCYFEKGERTIDLPTAINACRLLDIDLNEFSDSYFA